jgi:hypothetical protein
MDAHLELELRKMLAERDVRRQLFAYHEAMNRADYEALTALLGDAVITVCDAPRHRAAPSRRRHCAPTSGRGSSTVVRSSSPDAGPPG